ncbi:unnamed protein product [Cuscuta campestris]|uniref:Uncharacterized protein n=1 Tax=Cuscuta campestris TaxID=132261 RepID=A0A484K4W1_9ASTE|nr:unnamed protein product [Cuscuta campestris]
MVVQRHIPASTPASPFSAGQHASFAPPCPIPMCTSPPSKSTHAPSFSASIGHVGCFAGGGHGGSWTGGFGRV